MPYGDGTGRLGLGKKCNITARASRMGGGRRRPFGGRGQGRPFGGFGRRSFRRRF